MFSEYDNNLDTFSVVMSDLYFLSHNLLLVTLVITCICQRINTKSFENLFLKELVITKSVFEENLFLKEFLIRADDVSVDNA